MKSYSVKVNFVLNALRIVIASLIGIITMPYINRVLGPSNLGKVEFMNAIVSYFVMFSALGIPMYGIREIAKVKDNKIDRDRTVVELLGILFVTSVVSYIVLFICLLQFEVLLVEKELVVILSVMILLSNMSAEWYFQGLENQLYITLRFVVVRVIALLFLFFYVRESSDYLGYAIFIVLMTAGSGLFNFVFILRQIDCSLFSFKNLDFKRHLKPVLTIFIATISVNLYLYLDNFLLGTISGEESVGYYVAANKLIRYAISFLIILGSVLLPRLVNYYSNDKDMYFRYLTNAFYILLILSLSFSVYFYIMADEIIKYMAGIGFTKSIVTIKLLSPLCVVVAMAYFFGYLFLYSQNKERIYTIAVIFSAVFSVLCNYWIIPLFSYNGVAVVAVLSELLAILIMLYLVRKKISSLNVFNWNSFKIIFISLLLFLAFYYFKDNFYKSKGVFNFIIVSVFFYIFYFMMLFSIKEKTAIFVFNSLKDSWFKKK